MGSDSNTSSDAPNDAPRGDASMPNDGATTPDGTQEAGPAITLTGTVVDPSLVPLSGAGVHVQGHDATSGADGSFTLAGITTPYDATVRIKSMTGDMRGYVFQGLTVSTPTLQLAVDWAPGGQGTDITGNIPGTVTGDYGIVFAEFDPPVLAVSAPPVIGSGIGSSSYYGNLSWVGPATATATLYWLEYSISNGLATGYVAYSSQAAQTIATGTTTTWNPPAGPAPGSGSLTVTSVLSAGYQGGGSSLFMQPPGARYGVSFDQYVNTGSMHTYVTPDISATFTACATQYPQTTGQVPQINSVACKTGLDLNAQVTIALPPASTLVMPPTTASIGTEFDYTSLAGGIYLVEFEPLNGGPGSAIFLLTTDTKVKLPDLSSLGVSFQSGSEYQIAVVGLAPFASIDAAVTAAGYYGIEAAGFMGVAPTADGEATSSGASRFMFK